MSIEANVYQFPEENDNFNEFIKNAERTSLQNSQVEREVAVPTEQLEEESYEEDDFDVFMNNVAKTSGTEISAKDIKIDHKNSQGKLVAEEILEKYDKKEDEHQNNIPEEAYSIAFQFIKENGLLHMPEDKELTKETLKEIIQHDQDVRNLNALEYIKSRAGDEFVANLFDLVWNGGTYETFEQAKPILDDEVWFNNYDIKDADNQRKILELYFKEGLNENFAPHKSIIEEIPNRINHIMESWKGETEAAKALEYFKNSVKEAKIQLEDNIQKQKIEQEKLKAQKIQREINWKTNFSKNVMDSNWSRERKKEVLDHFGIVKLEDGTELPLWDYKMKKIWEKPELTKELFKFLSDLDPNELKFRTREKNAIETTTELLLKNAAKKAPTRPNSTGMSTNNSPITDIDLDKLVSKFGR